MTLQVCRDTFTLHNQSHHTWPHASQSQLSIEVRWHSHNQSEASIATVWSVWTLLKLGTWFNILAPRAPPPALHCTADTEYRNSDMWLFGLSFNDTLNWSAPSFMEATVESEILWLLAWALSFSKKMQDCACKCNKISAQKVLQQLCYNLSAT